MRDWDAGMDRDLVLEGRKCGCVRVCEEVYGFVVGGWGSNEDHCLFVVNGLFCV